MDNKKSLKYTYISELGSGSFGKAWLIRDIKNGKCLVSKQIKIQGLPVVELDRCVTEIAVLSFCRHVNIIRYVEAFVSEGMLQIIMEFADQGDLQKKIEMQKGLYFDKEVIMDWFIQVVQALDYIHGRNILHRDIKPQNVFLIKGDIIKLGDFGISKVLCGSQDLASTRIGTPFYISPEICDRKPYNSSSDMWAAGCLLYELCMLRVPFQGASLHELTDHILKCHYRQLPSEFGTLVPYMISRLLVLDPKQRMTARDILQQKFEVVKELVSRNKTRNNAFIKGLKSRSGQRSYSSQRTRSLQQENSSQRSSSASRMESVRQPVVKVGKRINKKKEINDGKCEKTKPVETHKDIVIMPVVGNDDFKGEDIERHSASENASKLSKVLTEQKVTEAKSPETNSGQDNFLEHMSSPVSYVKYVNEDTDLKSSSSNDCQTENITDSIRKETDIEQLIMPVDADSVSEYKHNTVEDGCALAEKKDHHELNEQILTEENATPKPEVEIKYHQKQTYSLKESIARRLSQASPRVSATASRQRKALSISEPESLNIQPDFSTLPTGEVIDDDVFLSSADGNVQLEMTIVHDKPDPIDDNNNCLKGKQRQLQPIERSVSQSSRSEVKVTYMNKVILQALLVSHRDKAEAKKILMSFLCRCLSARRSDELCQRLRDAVTGGKRDYVSVYEMFSQKEVPMIPVFALLYM